MERVPSALEELERIVIGFEARPQIVWGEFFVVLNIYTLNHFVLFMFSYCSIFTLANIIFDLGEYFTCHQTTIFGKILFPGHNI